MVNPEERVNNDPGTPISTSTYEWDEVDPSTAVVEAVASVAGCDPMALDPLTERVDPDALDRLIRAADEGTSITFTYVSYRVTVFADGEVAVQRTGSSPDS